MRIVVAGDTGWECRDLAAGVLSCLVAGYGPDIVIIHGNEPGVDSSFAAAARELDATEEVRVIDRNQTVFPTTHLFDCRADRTLDFGTRSKSHRSGVLTLRRRVCSLRRFW